MARAKQQAIHVGEAVPSQLQLAGSNHLPIPSPARDLHGSLHSRLIAEPDIALLPLGQRTGIIVTMAALSWAGVGSLAYLLLH